MAKDMSRSSTPITSLPLTPPPTGGFADRGSKLEARSFGHRTSKAAEGESLTEFFEELQEGSDVEIERLSRRSSISSNHDDLPATPTPEAVVAAPCARLHDQPAFEVSAVTLAPPVSEPFPFLKLPVAVRNLIYTQLLVVPGLPCVRQNRAIVPQDNHTSYLHAEELQLLPGIAVGTVCVTAGGRALHLSHIGFTNINILLASKEVYAQAKTIIYSKNDFEINKPSNELSPPPDLSVRLFPPGCQRLVSKLNIRIRSFYDLAWLLDGGHAQFQNFYRGLSRLTLVLELPSTDKGHGRMWAKQDVETWNTYIQRLRGDMAKDTICGKRLKSKVLPGWIKLSVVFSGESYTQGLQTCSDSGEDVMQLAKRHELRQGLKEAWELFKKDRR